MNFKVELSPANHFFVFIWTVMKILQALNSTIMVFLHHIHTQGVMYLTASHTAIETIETSRAPPSIPPLLSSIGHITQPRLSSFSQ